MREWCDRGCPLAAVGLQQAYKTQTEEEGVLGVSRGTTGRQGRITGLAME